MWKKNRPENKLNIKLNEIRNFGYINEKVTTK